MQELGRLEDLPQSYRDELQSLNLVPLWPSLRAAGGVLAGAVRWSEKSGEGIALGSAWAAASSMPSVTCVAPETMTPRPSPG